MTFIHKLCFIILHTAFIRTDKRVIDSLDLVFVFDNDRLFDTKARKFFPPSRLYVVDAFPAGLRFDIFDLGVGNVLFDTYPVFIILFMIERKS